jgi:nitrogen fixation NifU-like protein
MQLQQMYQEIILDHYKNPHGRGLRDPYDAESFQVNPTCGDEVTLRVHVVDDVVQDVSVSRWARPSRRWTRSSS